MKFRTNTMKKFVDGKYRVMAQPYNGYVPARAFSDSAIRKRYSQFNAWGPGFNTGPSIESFYENQVSGQLQLLPEGKMAIVDPMTTMTKTDSPLTNADTGAFNAIFGAAAVLQYAQRAALYNALPQNAWPSSGFRASSSEGISSGVGIAQSSDRPDSLEPTYNEIPITPKEIAVTTELSDVLVIQGETDDAITFSVNKEVMQSNFMDAWDADMLQDGDTLAGNNFESIDRITASDTTASNLGWTGGDEDLYSQNRSSATWFVGNSYDDSGSDRYLTRSLLDNALHTTEQYWTDPSDKSKAFWLTDHTTMTSWEALEEAKQFLTTDRAQFGVGGINTQAGQDAGVTLAKYKGIPIVQDKNVQTDTIGRIYLLNTDYVGLSFGRPLEFLTNDNPFVVGFNMMGLWHAIGEIRATKPIATASIRDLK
jgi:hypothetical protein